MATIADINVRIGAIIKPLEKALGDAERKLKRSGSKMAAIGSTLTRSLSVPILGMGAAALKAAGDYNALEKGLESIMTSNKYSPAAIKKEMELLRKESLKPGLNLEQAVKGSVRLQAVGLEADRARRLLAGMGNSIALVGGTATNLEIVNTQLSQMVGNGKILGQEIRTLKEQIPQASSILEKAFGTSSAEGLRDAGVSVDQLINTLITGLEKLPPATSGIKNAIANTGQAITVFLVSMGNELNDAFNITELADTFSTKLNDIATAFAGLDSSTKKTILKIAGFAAAIGPVFFVLGKVKLALAAVAGAIRTVFSLATLKSLLNPWTLAFAAIVTAAVLIVRNWDTVKKALVNVINSVITLYNTNLKFRASVEAIGFVFKALWKTAKTVFNNIKLGVSGLSQAISKLLKGDFSGAKGAITQWFKDDASNWSDLGKDIGNDFTNSLARAAKGNLNLVSEDIFKSLEAVGAKASTVFSGATASALGGGGGSTGPAEDEESPGIKTAALDPLLSTYDLLVEKQEIWKAALAGVKPITDGVKTSIDYLNEAMFTYDGVTTQIADKSNTLSDGMKNLLDTLADSATAMSQAIGSAVASGETNFKKLAKAALTAAKKIIAAKIATGITSVVSSALSNTPYPLSLVLAPLAGAAAGALFSGVISKVAGFEKGTNFAPGGLALVGEAGPELVNLKRGSQVVPNHKIGGMGGTIIPDVRITGNDLLLVFEKAQRDKNRIR